MFLQTSIYSQCTDMSIGDLDAKNLGYAPSNVYSCNMVTVTAEWDVTSQWPYDADFHMSTLIVTLPSQFVGTSATSYTITSSDGIVYWDAGSAILTDDLFTVDLAGSIPSSTNISIMIIDMNVDLVGPVAFFEVSQDVVNVEDD